MKHFAKVCAIMLAALMLLTGCETYDNFYNTFFAEPEEAPADVIYIGVFEPQSGQNASDAADEIAGIELAHSLYPEVLGAKVELVYADNQSSVERASEAAQELVDAGVSVVLGSCKSTLSLAGSDVFTQAEIPAIGLTCNNPIITETSSYYFRVCNISSYEGDAAARFAYNGLGAKKVSVLLKEGDDYDEALIDTFTNRMKSMTADEFCVKEVTYSEETLDYTDIFFDLSTSSSGVVYFPSEPAEAVRIMGIALEQGYNFTWVGSSSWTGIETANETYVENNSDYLLGICYTSEIAVESVETEMSRRFKEAYAEKYGADAVPSEAAALGFDGYLLALEGIRKAEGWDDTSLIAKRLYNVYNLQGAAGSISLDATGNPIKEVSVEQLGHDGPTRVYLVTPKWGE